MKRFPEFVLSITLLAVGGIAAEDSLASYREGRDAIDSQDWARAERCFREYLREPRPARGDAALFYLAFALKKQLRFAEARERLAQLLQKYPSSGWAEDAVQMEAEMTNRARREGSPEEAFAIQQRRSMAARLLVDNIASKDGQSLVLLRELALGGNGELASAAVRALKSYAEANQPVFLGQLAEAGKSTAGRRSAVAALLDLRSEGAAGELLRLFRTLPDRSLRKVIVADLGSALAMNKWAGARRLLTEIRDTAEAEDFRQAARHYLADASSPEALDSLLNWYALESDPEIRLTLIAMLGTMYGDQPQVRAKLQEIADGSDQQLAKQARGVLKGGGYSTTFPFLQRRAGAKPH